jgi:Zn-dependent protease
MDTATLIAVTMLLRFLILIPSIVIHEAAHGYAALWCGDDTAKRAGRLTLNPLAHIDLWGTILLPLFMLLMSGGMFAFGYAKPVPINPYRFRDERQGMLITGIAGPLSNLGMALIAGLTLRLLAFSGVSPDSVPMFLLEFFCRINLWLMFFNLIPIPPLDGSRVIQKFLPSNLRDSYHQLERFGFFIVLGILFLFPSLFSMYYRITVEPLFKILTGL